ncbi:MAG: hypothetical protein FWH41_04600 [Treponema sp.]|nr:hypothetical protein [Treponema sp.]
MDEKIREGNRLRQRRFLELHRDEVNEQRRQKYHDRIDNGKCPRCQKKVKKGQKLCSECCEYMKTVNNKAARQKNAVLKTKTQRTKAKDAIKKAPVKALVKAKAASKAKVPVKAKTPAKAPVKTKAALKAKAMPKTKALAKAPVKAKTPSKTPVKAKAAQKAKVPAKTKTPAKTPVKTAPKTAPAKARQK